MIKYLIEKEFRQIIRNSFLPKLIIMFPCMVILILPWAASMEIKNLNLCIIDNNQTSTSKRLIQKTISSGYFKLSGIASSYKAGMKEIVSQVGATSMKDIGKVMGNATKKFAGVADGKRINEMVKKLLG